MGDAVATALAASGYSVERAAEDDEEAVRGRVAAGAVGSLLVLDSATLTEGRARLVAAESPSALRQLGILRAKDVPEIEVELVEVPQPRSPYGIKGVGEIGLVPTAPAVAAALHDLDGEWRTTLPMKAPTP